MPSKVSLNTDQPNVSIVSPRTSESAPRNSKLSRSPSNKSLGKFGRELKHLNQWLDNREMQVRAKLEGTTAMDDCLEHNGEL